MSSLNNLNQNTYDNIYTDEIATNTIIANENTDIQVLSDFNIISPAEFQINGNPITVVGDGLKYDPTNNIFNSFVIDNYNRDVTLSVVPNGPFGSFLSAELNSGVRQNLILYQNYSQNSPISGYKRWSPLILQSPELEITQSITSGTVLFTSFAISEIDLNQTFISTGIFDIICFCSVAHINRANIFAELFIRDNVGVETSLGISDELSLVDVYPNIGEYQLSLALSTQIPINTGEYLVMKLYGKSMSVSATTIYWYFEGQSHYSNSITPLSISALLEDYYTKTEADLTFMQKINVNSPLGVFGNMKGPIGPTITIQQSSLSLSGFLSSSDFTIFNNKENTLTFSSPLSRATNTISIPQANASTNGFLSSSDWSLFNNKENVLSFSGPLSRVSNTISIPQSNASTNGFLSSSDFTSFNSKVSSQWTTNGTSIYYNTGNIGLGVVSPLYDLHVKKLQPTLCLDSTDISGISSNILFLRDIATNRFGSLEYDGNFSLGNNFPTGKFIVNMNNTTSGTLLEVQNASVVKMSVDKDGNLNITGNYRISGNQISTTNVLEGTNLYFTDTRSRNAISANSNGLTYNNLSGIFTLGLSSSTQNGALSSADWTTFNNKISSQWVTSGSNIYYNSGKILMNATSTTQDTVQYINQGNRFNGLVIESTSVSTVPNIRIKSTSSEHTINSNPVLGLLFQNVNSPANSLLLGNSSLQYSNGTDTIFTMNQGGSASIGNCRIGTWDTFNTAFFRLQNTALTETTATNYSIAQSNVGRTLLNSSSGQNMEFRIGNSTQMFLSSLGNVGIGTTTPTSKLTIAGDIELTSSYGIKNSTNSALSLNVSSGGSFTDGLGGSIVMRGTTAGFNNGGIELYTSIGAGMLERMRIISTGDVGLGTTTPNYALHIHRGTTATDVRIQLSDGTTTSGSTRGFHIIKGTNQFGYVWNYENQPLYFGTNNTERARFESSGNFILQNSIQFPNGGNSSLSHYQEALIVTSFSAGNGTVATISLKCIRIGRQVTITFPQFQLTIGTTNQADIDNVQIVPDLTANFRPTANTTTLVSGLYNNIPIYSRCDVFSTGNIYFFRDVSGTQYGANTTNCGITTAFSITYNIN